MKHASTYLKMRVLGALDTAPGRTRHERVHQVAAMTFVDEDGAPRSFTWRTIQTWWYRYKNHGITDMTPQPRSDKGHPRRVTPEELLYLLEFQKEAVRQNLDVVASPESYGMVTSEVLARARDTVTQLKPVPLENLWIYFRILIDIFPVSPNISFKQGYILHFQEHFCRV